MTHENRQQHHQHVSPQSGESAAFHFENCWRVNARAVDVWSVLADIGSWPQWWPGLPVAEPADDTVAPGSRADIAVNSPIGLTLSFGIEVTDTNPPKLVTFSAVGDLRGAGAWSLEETGPITTITSVWCVTTRRSSIRMMRPVSTWMHSRVMRAGNRGLASRLNRLTP